jgi:putative proteasome-type protease
LEDRMSLQASGITFDLHSLVGGQLDKDPHHKLYLVYPQGNWVEIGQGTPYHIIGAAGYGKPILDRTLHFADPLPFALKVGCLAFDSTRISAADVSFPLDVVICAKDTFQAVEQRYAKEDLAEMSSWWQDRLRRSINELPCGCIEELLSRLPNVGGV